MDNVEILETSREPRERNYIPKPLKVIGSIPIILNGLWIAVSALAFLGTTFGTNIVLGFIVLLTPLGWILATPVYLAFMSFAWFDLPQHISRFEYWTKVILAFFGALLVPWLVYYLIVMFEALILGFLYSFFK